MHKVLVNCFVKLAQEKVWLCTTRNAPYVHSRLDSILELCQAFPIEDNHGPL